MVHPHSGIQTQLFLSGHRDLQDIALNSKSKSEKIWYNMPLFMFMIRTFVHWSGKKQQGTHRSRFGFSWGVFWFGFFFFFFLLFRAAPTAYESSQARGQIRDAAASLHHSSRQPQILKTLSKAGFKPESSQILVGFLTTEPQQELPDLGFNFFFLFLAPHPWHMEVSRLELESEL